MFYNGGDPTCKIYVQWGGELTANGGDPTPQWGLNQQLRCWMTTS